MTGRRAAIIWNGSTGATCPTRSTTCPTVLGNGHLGVTDSSPATGPRPDPLGRSDGPNGRDRCHGRDGCHRRERRHGRQRSKRILGLRETRATPARRAVDDGASSTGGDPVRIAGVTLRKGVLRIRIVCPRAAACVTIRRASREGVVLGTTTFDAKGGTTITAEVRLSKFVLKRLSRSPDLRSSRSTRPRGHGLAAVRTVSSARPEAESPRVLRPDSYDGGRPSASATWTASSPRLR